MAAKQHATKQSLDYWRNKKIPRDKWKHNSPKLMGCIKGTSKMEVYINTILTQEITKISNKQPNLTPKTTRERTNKTWS